MNGTARSALRRRAVLDSVRRLGLLKGKTARIGGRIDGELLAVARRKSGLASDTELLEYALARVALEDDFAVKLLRRQGRIPAELDLEF